MQILLTHDCIITQARCAVVLFFYTAYMHSRNTKTSITTSQCVSLLHSYLCSTLTKRTMGMNSSILHMMGRISRKVSKVRTSRNLVLFTFVSQRKKIVLLPINIHSSQRSTVANVKDCNTVGPWARFLLINCSDKKESIVMQSSHYIVFNMTLDWH